MPNLNIPASLNPKAITEKTITLGRQKIEKSVVAQVLSGILAGAYIAFAGVISQVAAHGIEPFGIAKVVAGAVFASGLIYVMVAGADLFTGNIMLGITALFAKKTSLSSYVKNLLLLFVVNFLGALIVVAIVAGAGIAGNAEGALGERMVAIAEAKCSLSFIEAFMRGVGCNWLVGLAIWMAVATGDTTGKILACFFPVMTFVALGFEHSIANMYFIPLGLILKGAYPAVAATNLTWANFFFTNELPVTLGNIVGGALFVGGIYFAIYRPKGEKGKRRIRKP